MDEKAFATWSYLDEGSPAVETITKPAHSPLLEKICGRLRLCVSDALLAALAPTALQLVRAPN
ncbi:hypothetical protein AXF42_Ash013020 [Apostasia shenzhenica]|uniref:Uncharacterized protein n=1 Tax=Apostasia shenzhenica TaxID=1088818 RepID=A0A2I0AS50_9ASPA|nr:hypothetical protein AXF42_Ash013020 [Apostasia shenzhenica]